MREKITLLIIVLLITAIGGHAQSEPARTLANKKMVQAHVLSIDDSDRVTFADKNGTVYSAMLLAADAPEREQGSFKKARKKLSDLLEDKDVTAIVRDTGSGKFAAAIYVDGQDVSLRMLQDGLAWYYPAHAKELSPSEREKYLQAEAAARTAKTGLWDDKDPVAPWIFRGEKIEPESLKTEAAKADAVAPAKPFLVSDETKPVPGRTYILGPRGGCYYLNDKGYKVYVKDKSLCVKP
jgi:endonuclease YncB( thermonuclease family)